MEENEIDNRIRILIKNCILSRHRSLFVIVGERGRNNVAVLHELLSKEGKETPSVLWCYKKDLGFSITKKKKHSENVQILEECHTYDDDPMEDFIASAKIKYCCYSKINSILFQTFRMAILQDFEALTPILLASIVEKVEGGGIIVILLQTLTTLQQLHTMAMDVHASYRTEAHQHVICRFNERLTLSLLKCSTCLVIDDELNILPISIKDFSIEPLPQFKDGEKFPEEQELINLKSTLNPSGSTSPLIKLCETLDQVHAVVQFIQSLSDKRPHSIVNLSSARGRGKSAVLGLVVAAALVYNYRNIFVASLHPESLETLFKFLLRGLDAMGYEAKSEYEVVRSCNPKFKMAIIQVNVTKINRQTIKYIQPSSDMKLGSAELLVIDEAAAMPFSHVKNLLGPHLVFMASTINSFEGSGTSLNLKLVNHLKSLSSNRKSTNQNSEQKSIVGHELCEITVNEPILYRSGDKVEDWLNRLLCLDVSVPPVTLSESPSPKDCNLYYVNRDTLFSYNTFEEEFLHKLLSIFGASHYKISPDDLHKMADSPAHHIFCLCASTAKRLPEILTVLEVCIEGKLSENTVKEGLRLGHKGNDDLIPWTISKEFLGKRKHFCSLLGARVVRIVTHPEYQKKGYGLQALKLLHDFYEGKFSVSGSVNMTSTDGADIIYNPLKQQPRTSLSSLLCELSDIKPDVLDYIGVSYGLSEELFRFWKKAGFSPVCLSREPVSTTGELPCIMLKQLKGYSASSDWLSSYWLDFCNKMLHSFPIPKLSNQLSLDLISATDLKTDDIKGLSKEEVTRIFAPSELELLKTYRNNFNPEKYIAAALSMFYFSHRLLGVELNDHESIIFFSIGALNQSVQAVSQKLSISEQELFVGFTNAFIKVSESVLQLAEVV